ncbi:DUF485 domain-containing protein [Amycolatopsis cihanbeyliensis]|uniref:Uncharacterized membrane protein (DUF485 family) n=1 Tax=Amycolatopsis cihanbeyliensis TaxID=1128664 RepID=A0A542DDN1_AMYCI|nr:DUF485 domain-containing protein [Amycolatopsis cihanbeyliensis]TQJ01184.1 uncharacterized membrane protein (DUF485 family) [Amycolatopsis cihanbeyliensis]
MHDVARATTAGNPLEETGRIPVMFGGRGAEPRPATSVTPDFERIQRSSEFGALRRRLRRFVFPVSLLFFAWYLSYVLLAAYAHDFMSTKVFGQVNVAMVLGMLQFLSTVVVTVAYLRFARRQIDPRVAEIRRQAGVPEA